MDTKGKYTPGPWKVRKLANEVSASLGDGRQARIAKVIYGGINDCNLISAAPDMYEAIKAMLNKLDNMTTEQFSKGGEKAEREMLSSAIAKAEGK